MMSHVFLSACMSITAIIINMDDVVDTNISLSYGDWEEVRNTNGVKTYVRWIQHGNGKETRERKGETQVNCSLRKTIEILTDASATVKWMSGVTENYLLSRSNPAEWYTYTLYNIPWPFNNRDLVSMFEIQNNPGGKSVVINISSRADYVPPKPGIERLENYRATWTITETAPQKVQIEFCAISDTPPLFPRYIQDPVIEKMFHNNLVRLKELLSEQVVVL